jgi:hypothetical protein
MDISYLVKDLLASQAGLWSVELFNIEHTLESSNFNRK